MTVFLTTKQREVFKECAWSYSQASVHVTVLVREVVSGLGEAWAYFTLPVREAFVAQRCFAVVRASGRESVSVKQMDLLLAMMRVAAGLATLEEVA